MPARSPHPPDGVPLGVRVEVDPPRPVQWLSDTGRWIDGLLRGWKHEHRYGWRALVLLSVEPDRLRDGHQVADLPGPLAVPLPAVDVPGLGDHLWAAVADEAPPQPVDYLFQAGGWTAALLHRWVRSSRDGTWWGDITYSQDGYDRRAQVPATKLRRRPDPPVQQP